jgi:hypothetical protein
MASPIVAFPVNIFPRKYFHIAFGYLRASRWDSDREIEEDIGHNPEVLRDFEAARLSSQQLSARFPTAHS